MDDALRNVVDRLAITDLMVRYGLAIDGRDWILLREVFTSDGVVDYSDSGGFRGDMDATVPWLDVSLKRYGSLQHNMTNHVAEIDGDTARACTYFVAYHAVPHRDGTETLLTMGGLYKDHLRRTEERWKIASRVQLGVWIDGAFPNPPRWYGTMSRHLPGLPAFDEGT